MSTNQAKVIIERQGGCGILTLNRPEAMNALDMDMILAIRGALRDWREDENVTHIMVQANGERAFCSGGDVKMAYAKGQAYKAGEIARDELVAFFREEYMMNRDFFHYPKPTLAFMHGVTMGGGYGVAGNCRYQIACENTVFAMPETIIGLFTDVGSVYHFQSCPGALARYLVMTGNRLQGAECVYARMASHYAPYDTWGKLKEQVIEQGAAALTGIKNAPDHGAIAQKQDLIDEMFESGSVLDVLRRLEGSDDPWCKEVYDTLMTRSPTSVFVCAQHLSMGARDHDFDAVIERDFTLLQHFMEGEEFYEGVRAQLIDKDRNPQWTPAQFEDVDSHNIATLFKHNRDKLIIEG